MTSQKKINLIKTICWVGVAADALWAVALLNPQLYGILTGHPDLQAGVDMRRAMGVAAALMTGWTVLLIWTAQKPIERRAVMVFTAVPVIAGLFAVAWIGLVDPSNGNNFTTIWILVKTGLLGIAMLWGYHAAGTIAGEAVR